MKEAGNMGTHSAGESRNRKNRRHHHCRRYVCLSYYCAGRAAATV